jgi:phage tail protein X
MPITANTTDTTVEKLVTRMFGKLPAAKLRAATEATMAANPHLVDASNVPAGTVVVVPSLDVVNSTSVRDDARIADDTVKAIASELASYQEQMAKGLEQRAAALGETAKLTGSAQFKRDLAGVEEAAPFLGELDAALKAERREVTERREFLSKDISSLTEDLATLARQLE